MNKAEGEISAGPVGVLRSRWAGLGGSWTVFRYVVLTAAAWFLLKELAPLLRPLLLAVFLAYVILPVGGYVRGHVRGGVGRLVVLVGTALILAGVAAVAYRDMIDLTHQLPRLHRRVQELAGEASRYAAGNLPWLASAIGGTASAEEQASTRLHEVLDGLLNNTAGAAVEGLQVLFFLMLILVEAGRFTRRVHGALPGGHAERVLAVAGNVNAAMASYLKVKVKACLVLAVPATLVLGLFGVRYAVLWGTLTFLANFIPYLGSIVACALPIGFALLDADIGWQPVAMAGILIGLHVASAYLVEPTMTGKAIDLSPLVVLIALSFWGLCWGLAGMVLAVPLTVMLKIILESAPGTRPIARLMGEE